MLGWVVWVTGLPGSGKSTITRLLAEKVNKSGGHVQILSSDVLRRVLTPHPTYSADERKIFYGALVYIAKLLADNGVNVIIDATGNRRSYRNKARRQIAKFMEAYIKCPLDLCVEREKKRKRKLAAPPNIYEKAETGESITVPGFGVRYETPSHPEVTVDSARSTAEKCAEEIYLNIIKRFGLS